MAPTIVVILIWVFAALLIGSVIRSAVRWVRVRRKRRQPPKPASRRCRCGYDLNAIELARCPECGRVDGFDATAEELGLSEEQLKKVTEARARRER